MRPARTKTLRQAPTVPFPRRAAGIILVLSALSAVTARARAQPTAGATAKCDAPLTSEQVVRNLTQMNVNRAVALHSYEGNRTYRVEYRGFPGSRSAAMTVSVKYLSPDSKEFVIESASGSGLIIDKVFKKLLEAEKEALVAESQRRSALTQENYRFTLVGYEQAFPNALYVLDVEPRTKEKFLYRGKIWVDAADFAVVRMEVTPEKNPSFWTKNSQIEQLPTDRRVLVSRVQQKREFDPPRRTSRTDNSLFGLQDYG